MPAPSKSLDTIVLVHGFLMIRSRRGGAGSGADATGVTHSGGVERIPLERDEIVETGVAL